MINLKQIEETGKKFVPNKIYYIKYNKKDEDDLKKKFKKYRFLGFQDNDKLIFETAGYKECFLISDYISRHIVILSKEEYKTEANNKLWEKIEKVINE